ncbi:hypothetical protein Gotur_008573, partial [Gossypium turneri]
LNAIATTLHGSIHTTPSILCMTATVGMELADVYSSYIDIASSPGNEVHDPWAFYFHAALLR